MSGTDRWGPKVAKEDKQVTPEQFEAAWRKLATKLLAGESMQTDAGTYFVRCGRKLAAAVFCLQRLGHSASCSPHFANVCDAPLPKDKRCVFTAGHKGKCAPQFRR